MLTQIGMQLNPDYVKFEYLVKGSSLREKEEWLTHIKKVDEGATQLGQQAMAEEVKAITGIFCVFSSSCSTLNALTPSITGI